MKGKNKLLNIGYKGDRSYVTRGNNIGVFGRNEEGLKFVGTISKLQDMKGKNFEPKNVSLSLFCHQGYRCADVLCR